MLQQPPVAASPSEPQLTPRFMQALMQALPQYTQQSQPVQQQQVQQQPQPPQQPQPMQQPRFAQPAASSQVPKQFVGSEFARAAAQQNQQQQQQQPFSASSAPPAATPPTATPPRFQGIGSTAPVSMLTPLPSMRRPSSSLPSLPSSSSSSLSSSAPQQYQQAPHPSFQTPFHLKPGPAPPLPSYRTFPAVRFKEQRTDVSATAALLNNAAIDVQTEGFKPSRGDLAVVNTPMGQRVGFGSGSSHESGGGGGGGGGDMRFATAQPNKPDGAMKMPPQARQWLGGSPPQTPQALLPSTAPPPPALMDNPPLPFH